MMGARLGNSNGTTAARDIFLKHHLYDSYLLHVPCTAIHF
jgi:hypothetical protein